MYIGTVAYSAPETFSGDAVGPRRLFPRVHRIRASQRNARSGRDGHPADDRDRNLPPAKLSQYRTICLPPIRCSGALARNPWIATRLRRIDARRSIQVARGIRLPSPAQARARPVHRSRVARHLPPVHKPTAQNRQSTTRQNNRGTATLRRHARLRRQRRAVSRWTGHRREPTRWVRSRASSHRSSSGLPESPGRPVAWLVDQCARVRGDRRGLGSGVVR